MFVSFAVLGMCVAAASMAGKEDALKDKTLIVWASPSTLDQSGGSALTVNDLGIDRFDAIVFAELEPQVWMPGSNGFSRTCKQQSHWPKETLKKGSFVQIAIVYKGQDISIYRNGQPYASYATEGEIYSYGKNTAVLMGQRHLAEGVECFRGRVRDARIYDQALDGKVIAELEPGKPYPNLEPWAWWDFASAGTYDKAGRFNQVRLTGGARIEDGCLILEGEYPTLLATRVLDGVGDTVEVPTYWQESDPVPVAVLQSTRLFREKLLGDAYRPGYHFCVPEDMGRPGDPNGCFYAKGRYHLMYLYNRSGVGFCWGHLSSEDLLHWRHHPDAIGPGGGDEGCFSGGGFVDDDGTAYLSYWMLWGDKGIGIAKSMDAWYDHWQKLEANPVIRSTEWGLTETADDEGNPLVYGSADPTNIWKKDGAYFMLTGNLLVLNKYGRKPDSPKEMKGDHLYLFESEDLVSWRYRGEFYQRNPKWTEDSEDNMCPSFLPLPSRPDGGEPSGKHLLLFISHNKGCQYYVGEYDRAGDRFLPETHGRMTWVDNTYFAPEALVDDRGRQIMWAWLVDNPEGEQEKGWSGVYGLPRSLWLGEDGALNMRPVEELKRLRAHEREWTDLALEAGTPRVLEGFAGDSFELEIQAELSSAHRLGVQVRVSPKGEEKTTLYVDAEEKRLCFDSTQSGIDGRKTIEKAPFAVRKGELLNLRVFVDKSVVEVYANDRQAICRRVYPGREDSLGVQLFAAGGQARVRRLRAWEMMPSNPY